MFGHEAVFGQLDPRAMNKATMPCRIYPMNAIKKAITAGGKLSAVSGRDTTVSGANLAGDRVDMMVGRNLKVESVKDHMTSKAHSFNAGGQMTIGMGATSGNVSSGGGGNIGFTTGSGSSDFIGRQTSIIGANGVNIFTEDNTHIKGAIIAADNDNLTLNTGTLSFEDMRGSRKTSSLSLGVSGSWDSKPDSKPSTTSSSNWLETISNKRDELKDQWGTVKKILPSTLAFNDTETRQTARATVGGGTIIVRDTPGADLSGLNRDPSQAISTEKIRDASFNLADVTGTVDKAFTYTGHVLNAADFLRDLNKPGKESEEGVTGKKPAKNPFGFIKEEFNKFYGGIKKAWGIKDKGKKS
jgi:filamentous hemagglutinin